MQKTMIHMHQIRDFIDDKHSYYNKYFNNRDPRFYDYKGVRKAFVVGSATDYAIKQYYLNLSNGKNIEDGIFKSKEFESLARIDKIIVLSIVNGYISKYNSDEETGEYFHHFQMRSFKVPLLNYEIYCSPDIIAFSYFENELYIIEIKTSGEDDKKYSAETLDFQTMTYAWGLTHFTGLVPKAVIKRTLMKPRIKQRKNETSSQFEKRLAVDVVNKPDQYLKSGVREVSLHMVLEFEKYLVEILKEMNDYADNKYKYYKNSNEYWGV